MPPSCVPGGAGVLRPDASVVMVPRPLSLLRLSSQMVPVTLLHSFGRRLRGMLCCQTAHRAGRDSFWLQSRIDKRNPLPGPGALPVKVVVIHEKGTRKRMCCSASSTTFRSTSNQVHQAVQVVVPVGEQHSAPDQRRVSAVEVFKFNRIGSQSQLQQKNCSRHRFTSKQYHTRPLVD